MLNGCTRMRGAECFAGDWILGGMAHIEFTRRNAAADCNEIGQTAVSRTGHLATIEMSW